MLFSSISKAGGIGGCGIRGANGKECKVRKGKETDALPLGFDLDSAPPVPAGRCAGDGRAPRSGPGAAGSPLAPRLQARC